MVPLFLLYSINFNNKCLTYSGELWYYKDEEYRYLESWGEIDERSAAGN